MATERGSLYILSGPSGSGKDTILAMLRRRHTELEFSVSCVTRSPRPGERDAADGGKYRFISKAEFLDMLAADGFLEYNEYLGNYYGTPKDPVDGWLSRGRDVILEIDVNGAEKVRRKYPGAVSVFIIPPSLEVLKKRLYGRSTEAPEIALKRLGQALVEISRAGEYDYIIVNDVLENAVDDFCAIIREKRLRKSRMLNIVNEVLKHAESIHRQATEIV